MADQKAFKKRLKVLMNRTENLQCVDCNEKQPRWASLIKPPPGMDSGMGAFMCLECSGSHRRLGVHISFVRSVNLDSWKEHEVAIMENGGNDKVNAAYEAHLNRSGSQKPTNLSNGQQRERYIRDKYERRKFYDPNALDDYESAVEEVAAKPSRKISGKAPTAAMSRAPSDAARRRAEARNARLGNAPAPAAPERPARVVAAAPAVDLLDFASFESAPTAPPLAAATTTPVAQPNATLDLFADMAVSGPAPAAPANKTNDDILSLFSTPTQPTSNTNNMQMMGGMPQGGRQQGMPQQGMQQGGMHQGMPQQGGMQNNMHQGGMQNNNMQQMTPQQQQQMMMQMTPQQQQQMMMQQQQMMQQRTMMMQQQQNGGQMMMPQGGMPQQQQMYNTNGQMPQQQQMMQMQQQMQQQGGMQGGGMMMMPQQQPNDGGFGAPMGSGPSISSIQGTAAPPKQDPFAEFGFNAFR